MQVGISTACFFTRRHTEDTLLPMAQMGARRYEAFLSGYLEYERPFAQQMERRQRDCGLACTAVHALGSQFEPQLFSAGQRQREGALAWFHKVLACAQCIGASKYVMHGSFYLKRTRPATDYARLGDQLCGLAEIAATYGVRLTLENVHWCVYAQSGMARQLAPYVADSALGYTLDVKQAAQAGEDAYAYLQDMGERLCNVHLCDLIVRDGAVQTRLPGQGEFDFSALADVLKRTHPEASVTMEVYPSDYQNDEQLAQAYQLLCKLFA